MGESLYKILVVDDEEDIVEFIGYNLERQGFRVKSARNGREAIQVANTFRPHLILLDIMMPEMDGIETCQEIRTNPDFSDTIIAFLTARSEDYSQISGYRAGGDDYITKPVRPRVLVSKIKALLKRQRSSHDEAGKEEETQNHDGLIVDSERYLVVLEGREIDLPKKEFMLLSLLTSRPSMVFTRDEIYKKLWGPEVYVSDRTIDVYIRKIREKIGTDRIKTIKGVGYKFKA